MAEPLAHEQRLNLWPERPAGTPPDLQEQIVDRSKSLFRADRALMGIAEPSLTAFLPEKPNGTSLIIAPGGSYQRVVLDKEGIEIAQALAAQGVTAFLLAYRLPGEGHDNAADAPLADGQRAVRLVRQHPQEWGLDPARVGFLGFSAAGHLGASLSVGFDRKVYAPIDAVDQVSARPDFSALIYPVVTMQDDKVHEGSRKALLGDAPTREQKDAYSPELHVTSEVPETFIVFADDDPAVPTENAIRYYSALRNAGVKAEMHIYRDGGHGFGIKGAQDLPVAGWPRLFSDWLERTGMVPASDS
ncbi:alpha/beta hydrolase fold domain-containing protein [Paracoccus aestuariivivens]|uniref:Alpha/beta hydrolase fold domain-containing protein n=2 Tax=Paracoccus aestuariivivens TaxID=1820333 RepID=A0A6L6J9U6_9RHOB|nr:alpha/beta hydrolase fold domain-containing protein [Paracoccus aestuariivivens]